MVMQLLNMQLNKVISMYNIQDTVDSLKNELEFLEDSTEDLRKRLDRLSKKQSLVNSFESPAD
jgi:archaellum component FlaC